MSRHERARLIVSSNESFSAWPEIFGDAAAAEAMVDRLVHHAEVIVLQGESCRLKDRAKEVVPQNPTLTAHFWTGESRAIFDRR